jgi:O-antigen/teichoic acid export membrane protein
VGGLREALRLVGFATFAMAVWLVVTIVAVLPARDPAHIPMWAVVAVGSVVLAVLTMLGTRREPGPDGSVVVALGVVAVAALGFGLVVLGSELTDSGTGEGYLFLIGLLLTAHGVLALAWLAGGAGRRRQHREMPPA